MPPGVKVNERKSRAPIYFATLPLFPHLLTTGDPREKVVETLTCMPDRIVTARYPEGKLPGVKSDLLWPSPDGASQRQPIYI